MKRKKQLLSWILSFLMVFSIMPMMSISAFAYDIADGDTYNVTVYPGEVIRDINDYIHGIRIWYYSNDDDYMDNPAKEFNESDASTGHTIASPQEANLVVPDGYVFDNYNMVFATSSGGEITQVHLIAQWKKVHKITYDMTNITVSDIDVDGEEYDIGGETYVTSGASVTITIAAEEGYRLPDTIGVEMGETELEDSNYEYNQATGEIGIDNVTGDVEITAAGVKLPSATIDVSNVTKTSAALSSDIILGDEDIIDQGFEWKKNDGGSYVQIPGALSNEILTANLTDLSENTSYTVRAFIETESGIYYGNEIVFKTNNQIPSVTTNVTNVTKTSAVLSGTVNKGSEEIVDQGFEWKKTDGGTYVQQSGTLKNGTLTVTLTGLTKNTRYIVRPFVVTETNTYYGAENTFRTKKSTSSGSSSSSSSSSSNGSGSDTKSDISIVEPTEEAIIKALKTPGNKKIQVNIDSNPNLLLSKAIIDALTVNKDKTLIVVSSNVSTSISINENNEMKFTRNGSILAGFASVFNSEYYLNYNGIVQKGWILFPGERWYYLDKETGIRGQGWINDNGNWYYLNPLGIMQTGWINDSGVWYYLNKSGKMLANTTIDGYVLGSSGAWIA